MRRAVSVLAVALTAPAAATTEPQQPVYIVERVGAALPDDTAVGYARAGLICAPDKGLKWKDVTAGGAVQQREIVADELDDLGLRTSTLMLTGAGRRGMERRIVGEVTAARFALCDRHWGLGHAHALSGTAALTVRWRVETLDGAAAPIRRNSAVTLTIAPGDAAALGTIYQRLLKAAADDLARTLGAGDEERADPSPRP